MKPRAIHPHRGAQTSIDKALEVCELLAGQPRGASLSDLARSLRQPPSTVHRLLAVLKRRGYVR
ncbi:MAG: helix-turn-helix domain-containing protein, partial [Acidobacteriota bacterium]|nr:helix-turn-helix domain-containing protein [Acidobacteriota bacterium]